MASPADICRFGTVTLDIRVCFLELVQQNDAVRLSPYLFGELPRFFEPDVSGRRPDEARNRMPLHVLAHVNSDHRLFITKDRFRKGFGQFRLSHARGSEEEEGCDGTAAVAQPGARQTHGIGYGSYRLVLTDDPLMQTLFHLHQPGALLRGELCHRNAGQTRNDLCHILDAHLIGASASGRVPFLQALIIVALVFFDTSFQRVRALEILAVGCVVTLAPQLIDLRTKLVKLRRS